MSDLHQKIIRQIMSEFYDQPIMSNLARPHYIERLIALGLGGDWKLVSANWSGWDIENATGVRIEVKQSAARQVWTDRPSLRGRPKSRTTAMHPSGSSTSFMRAKYRSNRRQSVSHGSPK